MTRRQWIIIIALIALNCVACAALASQAAIYWSNRRAVAQPVFDPPGDKQPEISTPTASASTVAPTPAAPTSIVTPTRIMPTRTVTPARTVPASTAASTPATQTRKPTPVAISPTATRTVAATRSPAAAPSLPSAPQPTPILRSGTVADTLLNPFAAEAYRRRNERARLDPAYARRVDQKLNQGRINFLLFGYGETHEPPLAVDVIIGSLTILSVDLRTGRADIVSLTHDTRAPEIERILGKPSVPVKIDQAYRVGGFDLMRRTVEDATGLSIDFQIAFRDSALSKLVDDVFGPIEIDNPADFKVQPFYLDGKMFEEGRFGRGRQYLNGMQTIQYIKALTARHDPALERNVRKVVVFRALLDGVNQRCHDSDFWLRISSFVVGQSSSKTIQYDFDPLRLLVSHLPEAISSAARYAKGEGCDLGASRIRRTLYVVDAAVGDGGVQWLAMAVLSNPIAKRDLESGVYPNTQEAIELPINGNPYGDLISQYWQAVRSLVKQRLTLE